MPRIEQGEAEPRKPYSDCSMAKYADKGAITKNGAGNGPVFSGGDMTKKHWIVWLLSCYRDCFFRFLPSPLARLVSFAFLGELAMEVVCYLDPDDRLYEQAYALRVAD